MAIGVIEAIKRHCVTEMCKTLNVMKVGLNRQ